MLFYEFLPYLAIVCMNLVVPQLFNYLVQYEKYSPLFVIKISLFRTVFLLNDGSVGVKIAPKLQLMQMSKKKKQK